MAHLLGSKSCIESLRRDVVDIQATVAEAAARLAHHGHRPARVASWKYPDRAASEIEVGQLVEEYCYAPEQPEENQLAHIVMLEMVVDRLVYLTHMFSHFLLHALSRGEEEEEEEGRKPPVSRSTCTGIAVKKLWSDISLACHTLLSAHAENGRLQSTVDALEQALEALSAELDQCRQRQEEETGPLPRQPSAVQFSRGAVQASSPSLDIRSVGSQTLQTAFTCCESCGVCQQNVLNVCDGVRSMCDSLGLQCTLASHLQALGEQVQVGEISLHEVNRLSRQQCIDLSAIENQCRVLASHNRGLEQETDNLKQQVSNLTDQIASYSALHQSERSQAKTREKKLQAQLDAAVSQHRRQEQHLQDRVHALTQSESEALASLERAESQRQELQCQLESHKQQVSRLSAEKEEQQASRIAELEGSLERERKLLSERSEEVGRLRQDMEATASCLSKERARSSAASRRDHDVKRRQDTLVMRLEELDGECEELRSQLCEAESERDHATQRLTAASAELDPLRKQLAQQEHTIHRLTQQRDALTAELHLANQQVHSLSSEVDTLKEHNNCLILFPDLTEVPSNLSRPEVDPSHPDSMVHEMQQQLFSNTLRIAKLDELNTSLRQSLARLQQQSTPAAPPTGQATRGGPDTQPKDPIPLWQQYASNGGGAQPSTHAVSVNNLTTGKADLNQESRNNVQEPRRESSETIWNSASNKRSARQKSAASSSRHQQNPPGSGHVASSRSQLSGAKSRQASSGRPFACAKCAHTFKTTYDLQIHNYNCSSVA